LWERDPDIYDGKTQFSRRGVLLNSTLNLSNNDIHAYFSNAQKISLGFGKIKVVNMKVMGSNPDKGHW